MVSGLTVSICMCGQVMDLKPDLMAALAPVTAKEAPERDTGHIPGDRRGAAGEIFIFLYIFLAGYSVLATALLMSPILYF
jgi:hypothetical protein